MEGSYAAIGLALNHKNEASPDCDQIQIQFH